MKIKAENQIRLNILGDGDRPSNREILPVMLKHWRQTLGYFSMFTAFPTIFASPVQEADALKGKDGDIEARTGIVSESLDKSCAKPVLLRRRNSYLLPRQKSKYDIVPELAGRDDCPGTAVPTGIYTASAPFTDTGDTTGANDTVNRAGYIEYCYYNYNTAGPDQIYSFTLSGRGQSPQIQVSAGSANYRPRIYVMDGRPGACPSGTGTFTCGMYELTEAPSPGGSATLGPSSIYRLPLHVPLHLFVDGAAATDSGPYTVRIQDVTIAPGSRTKFDFDRDARADLSVFRPSDGSWYLNRSTQGFSAIQFGLSTDRIAPADYDADGRTDVAVFRGGVWYWVNSSDGTFKAFQFGSAGDIPQSADFDGDGRAELALYRAGTWYTYNLQSNQSAGLQFGIAGDEPVAADYDGDGRADHAVFRSGTWHMRQSLRGFVTIPFGIPNDRPVPADYDGDSITDFAVFRSGTWFLRYSRFGWVQPLLFGLPSDTLVPGDYNGDGKAQVAVYRDGIWYVSGEFGNSGTAQRFGLTNDQPMPSAYLR